MALLPDPGLLQPAAPPAEDEAGLVAGRWRRGGAKIAVEMIGRPPVLDAKVLFPACPATASSFQADIDRLSGVAPLDAAGTITSRHTGHPDNARVVDALLAELEGDRLLRLARAVHMVWPEPATT